MTIDLAIISDRLQRLDSYLATLARLADLPHDDLIDDSIPLGSTERYLHLAIECCLDIANHLVAGLQLREPENYADVFAVLTEANILPDHFLPMAQQMARFRNRLVHVYWDIDAEVIYTILHTRVDEFEHFKGYILKYLDEQGFIPTP